MKEEPASKPAEAKAGSGLGKVSPFLSEFCMAVWLPGSGLSKGCSAEGIKVQGFGLGIVGTDLGFVTFGRSPTPTVCQRALRREGSFIAISKR